MALRPESPLPPAGRLTMGLFHMKKNYTRWREHGAPGWLLVYTLGGRGRFGHERGELLVEKGDLVLLQPKVRNDYGLEPELKRWDLLWAYFFPPTNWHVLLKWPEEAPGLLRLHLPAGISRTKIIQPLMEAYRLNMGSRRHREMFALNVLEKVLLLCDRINPDSEQSHLDARVFRAMDYLCQNLSRPVPLSLLARECGLSISRLAHLFRRQVGQSPHQFLEMQRMAQARQLLELTQESVTAIASQVGFPDLFHFSRRFRHHLGVSPRHYRQNLLVSSL
jgi:AraC family transcriptional regulator of arabinose operon